MLVGGCAIMNYLFYLESRDCAVSQTSGVRWKDKFDVRTADKVPKPDNLATFSLLLIVGIYYPSVRFAQLYGSDN